MSKKTIASLSLALAAAVASCSKVNEGDGVPKNADTQQAHQPPAAPGNLRVAASLPDQIAAVKDQNLKTALTGLLEAVQGGDTDRGAARKIYRAASRVQSAYVNDYSNLKIAGEKNPARDRAVTVAVLESARNSAALSGAGAETARSSIDGLIAAVKSEHPEQVPAPAP